MPMPARQRGHKRVRPHTQAPPPATHANTSRPDPRPQATGQSVLAELARQRETIQRSQATLDDAGQELKGAEGTLKRMSKWFFG